MVPEESARRGLIEHRGHAQDRRLYAVHLTAARLRRLKQSLKFRIKSDVVASDGEPFLDSFDTDPYVVDDQPRDGAISPLEQEASSCCEPAREVS